MGPCGVYSRPCSRTAHSTLRLQRTKPFYVHRRHRAAAKARALRRTYDVLAREQRRHGIARATAFIRRLEPFARWAGVPAAVSVVKHQVGARHALPGVMLGLISWKNDVHAVHFLRRYVAHKDFERACSAESGGRLEAVLRDFGQISPVLVARTNPRGLDFAMVQAGVTLGAALRAYRCGRDSMQVLEYAKQSWPTRHRKGMAAQGFFDEFFCTYDGAAMESIGETDDESDEDCPGKPSWRRCKGSPAERRGVEWVCVGCKGESIDEYIDVRTTSCDLCGAVACGECAKKGYPHSEHLCMPNYWDSSDEEKNEDEEARDAAVSAAIDASLIDHEAAVADGDGGETDASGGGGTQDKAPLAPLIEEVEALEARAEEANRLVRNGCALAMRPFVQRRLATLQESSNQLTALLESAAEEFTFDATNDLPADLHSRVSNVAFGIAVLSVRFEGEDQA